MISDQVLAMFELANDLLYGRIPKDRYGYYTGEALRLGREAAAACREATAACREATAARQEDGDIYSMYEKAGIEILYQEQGGTNYGISFRAQTEFGKDGSAKVLIYRGSIAALAAKSGELDAELSLDEDQALRVHLAHEYFHYLEENGLIRADDGSSMPGESSYVPDLLESVELPRILGRRRKAGVLRCSEIAAHAFAKELLGLSVLPNYYDYTYLIAEGKLGEEEFLAQAALYA